MLSHLRGDHFDRVAEERLDKTLPIVTTPHAARYLEGKGFRPPTALDTWEPVNVHKGDARLRITAMPGTHAPAPLRKVLPPVMGSMLEFGPAEGDVRPRLYITGDTLLYDRPREIPERYPEIDLALLHLGGTRVLGLLVTMDAGQGVEAMRILAPRTAVPIHYNYYTVFNRGAPVNLRSLLELRRPAPREGGAADADEAPAALQLVVEGKGHVLVHLAFEAGSALFADS